MIAVFIPIAVIAVILVLIICIAITPIILNNKKIEKKELRVNVNKEKEDKVQYSPKLTNPNVYDKELCDILHSRYYEDEVRGAPIYYTKIYIKPKRHRRYYKNYK